MSDAWSKAVRKPEPGKVHLGTLPPGTVALLWDDREVVVESVNKSGVTVSETREGEIAGKLVKSKVRTVISWWTNVRRK